MKPIVAILVSLIAGGLLVTSRAAWGEGSMPDPIANPVASHGAEAGMAGMDHETGMVVVPTNPIDGVLSIVIPRGTDAAMKQSGNAGYHMPSIIRLHAGDTIVIRNDDVAPHMILYTFL